MLEQDQVNLQTESIYELVPIATVSPPPLQIDGRKRIREAERKASYFMANHKYTELLTAIESMQNMVREYFKITAGVMKEMGAMRSFNRARKKQEIILLYNRAVVHRKKEELERSIQLMMVAIEEINNMIQSQQIRYGFLDQADEQQRNNTFQIIDDWRKMLIKYYYKLAMVSYEANSVQIAMASILKGLDLIKQIYKEQVRKYNKANKEVSQVEAESQINRLRQLQELQELSLICQLKEKVNYSKYLNIVSINNLLDLINSIFTSKRQICSSLDRDYDMDQLCQLQLPSIQKLLTGTELFFMDNPQQSFQQIKTLHFLNYNLLTTIYAESNNLVQIEYQKLKNTKNIIFLHILATYLFEKYLPACNMAANVIGQYMQMYQIKSSSYKKQIINIHTLMDIFGIKASQLIQQDKHSLQISIIDQKKQQNQKEAKPRTKRIQSKTPAKAKSKGKSKEKIFIKTAIVKQELSKNKRKTPIKAIKLKNDQTYLMKNKQRVRQEYMIKNQNKKMIKQSDHLLKALNQNNRSRIQSTSNQKKLSQSKRHIRTQTLIAQNRSKDTKNCGKTHQQQQKTKKWY